MKVFSFFVFLLFTSSTCFADIKLCNGVWTNGDCDRAAVATLPEQMKATPKVMDPNLDAKRSLVVSFQSFRKSIQDSWDFYLDTLPVDEICLSPKSSVEECRRIISDYENKLEVRASLAKEVGEKEKEEVKPPVEQNVVQIIDNRYVEDYYRRNHREDAIAKRREEFNERKQEADKKQDDVGYTLSEQLTGKRSSRNQSHRK